jgi:hypothetical protein
MKKIFQLLLIVLNVGFLYSCAKPTVVEIILPTDEKLNCEELKSEVAETIKIKKDAEYVKEGTGGNIARMMVFWPAWARTLHNADVAIQAANDRNFHLIKIMKSKKCEGVDNVNAEIQNSNSLSESVAEQLKIIKEMYDAGDLSDEEFKKAKDKTLNQ